MRTPRRLLNRLSTPLTLSVALLLLVGCGGSQAAQTEPEQPVAQVEPTPVAPEEPSPPEISAEHVYYQVFWRGIHVLTIYRGAGTIRSEEPEHPDNVLPEQCSYMSAISHYFEHEAEIADLIAQVDDIDAFLALLLETNHEIDEEQFEEGY